MGTALTQLATYQDRQCAAWSTLSGSAVTQLIVTSSRDATSALEARTLYNALLTAIRRTEARSEPARCGGSFGPGAEQCWATSHPGAVRRVLIWVADHAVTPSYVNPTPSQAPLYHVVLPLLPNGASIGALPSGLASLLVRTYAPGQVTDAIPDVLAVSGLSADAFRIFISYRHADCAAVAEQLFDALSHQQFDVYLDRFRTLPGANFLERIRFELSDKACVLLLDSKDVGASDWVRGEYAFARKYQLGLMAVDLPGGTTTFPRIATRVRLASGSTQTFAKDTELSDQEIAKATSFIRDNYGAEVARRFRYQRRLILSAAALSTTPCSLRVDGNFDISGAGKDYVVAATTRPPALATLRPVSQAAGTTKKGVLIGPRFSSSHSASTDIDWLASKTNSVVIDERRLKKAMTRMARGQL